MRCNYHNHTYRCGHASGTEEDYIKKAIAEGITTIGFSDHTPYFFPGNYLSYCRMEPHEIGGYFDTLLALKQKYRGYIDVKIGFETEYYPRYFDRLIEEYRKYPVDYIIWAGHYIGHEGAEDCFCGFDRTDDKARMRAYVDNAIAAMNTGRFSILAHPDMIHYVGDLDFYRQEATRLIREAKRLDIPLEINLNGIRDKRYYPCDDFWRIVGSVGASAVIGFDAHQVVHVADRTEMIAGIRYADKFGINRIDEVRLRNPKF